VEYAEHEERERERKQKNEQDNLERQQEDKAIVAQQTQEQEIQQVTIGSVIF
jgi:hypothetical protein